MQADGHIGAYFPTPGTVSFISTWFISQNASTGSIEFFALHVILTSLGAEGLGFHYTVTSRGNWHIRMYSRDLSTILSFLKVYFSSIYGDKYTAFHKLIRVNAIILELSSLSFTTLQRYHLMIEVVYLIYSLSSARNSVRKLSLMDKLVSIAPARVIDSFGFVLGDYPNNTTPLT